MVCLADVQGTVIAKSAVIRAAADPNSEKLASVPSGKKIDIISKTSGTDNNTWYQVYVNSDQKGYIRSDLIKVPDGADIPTTQGGAASTQQPADTTTTTANPVDPRQGHKQQHEYQGERLREFCIESQGEPGNDTDGSRRGRRRRRQEVVSGDVHLQQRGEGRFYPLRPGDDGQCPERSRDIADHRGGSGGGTAARGDAAGGTAARAAG